MTENGTASAIELTVIIPARNEERLIAGQLSALAEQEWGDGVWEVIVVDNQSTDRTTAVAESFAHRFNRFRVIAADDRPGLSYARNTGIAQASGELIAICDADDIVAPGWVEAMGHALRHHRFVTGLLEVDLLNPKWLADSRGRGAEHGPSAFAGYFPSASGGNLGLHRSLWSEIGGFADDAQGAEDTLFSMEAWLRGVPLHFAPEAILHYRYRADPGSLWRQGTAYGRSRAVVYKELRRHGYTPPRFAGWRSWVWLIANLPRVIARERRLHWIWVAGNRFGHVRGSIRHRIICL